VGSISGCLNQVSTLEEVEEEEEKEETEEEEQKGGNDEVLFATLGTHCSLCSQSQRVLLAMLAGDDSPPYTPGNCARFARGEGRDEWSLCSLETTILRYAQGQIVRFARQRTIFATLNSPRQ
jgi:hypothetical protein